MITEIGVTSAVNTMDTISLTSRVHRCPCLLRNSVKASPAALLSADFSQLTASCNTRENAVLKNYTLCPEKRCRYQWWANCKSNHSPKSQITGQKDLNRYAKSQIKSHEMKIKSKSLEPKSQMKSNHDVNQMTTVPYSMVYGAKCRQCTSGLTVNVSAKIRDGTITEINSLTQLQ